MNTSTSLRTLAFLALGFCLVLAAPPTVHKIYIIRHSPTLEEIGFIFGLESAINEKGEEIYTSAFGVLSEVWDNVFENYLPENTLVDEVSFEQLPVEGLFAFIKYRTDFYSELLPIVLTKTSPKEVAEKLPAELLKTLTPEAKEKISPEDLAELKKLYGQ